jgi:hypothetical protein
MKKNRRLTHAMLIAAMSLGLTTGVKAADAEGRARVGGVEGRAQLDTQDRFGTRDTRYDQDRFGTRQQDRIGTRDTQYEQDRFGTTTRTERRDVPGYGYAIQDDRQQQQARRQMEAGGLPDHRQAGNIIGMNVRNQQGENLGRITDLAVDLESGRIGYAVLGVGGFLGLGEKLVAVPPHALQYDPGANALILNTTREQIEQTRGFARNNWPALDGSAAWGGDAFLDVQADRTGGQFGQPYRQDRDGFGARFDAEVGTGAGRYDQQQRYDQQYGTGQQPRYDQRGFGQQQYGRPGAGQQQGQQWDR